MKKYLLAGALAGAFSMPAAAANVTYDSYSFVGESVNITSPHAISGGAGPITLYEHGAVVVKDAWCLDVNNYLAGNGTVGILPGTLANLDSGLPGVPTTLSSPQLGVIAWLIKLGDAVDTNSTLSAAFQVAIWTEEYGASFHYDSLGSAFTNDVTNDLATALGDFTAHGTSGFNLSFLVPGPGVDSQTLVFGAPGAPEPSTWAMGLIGFAVLGAIGYRRRAQTLALAS